MQSYMILKVQRDFTAYVNLFFYKLLTKTLCYSNFTFCAFIKVLALYVHCLFCVLNECAARYFISNAT
ncbi:hypothetical protein A2I98_17385 [Pseudoalteromonas agarivorans]|uniref:Uncharacterized protein n=1 Tax=Pseudoalteromonas agarivorans TaxID=176102 RepID=A0ABR5VQ65_9GAMM|nr:hypothetical protein A2I98_17385 [Pseudoalteromonas telluritireducens]